jgi:cyanobactin maturation PatA/PatG family protease
MTPDIQLLWAETLGDPEVRVALLDGPVDINHPSLSGARLLSLPTLVPNVVGDGVASRHGTSVASVLFGQHSAGLVRGVAPRCTGLLLPIFSDNSDPVGCSQVDLARAIVQATENRAHIINVNAGQFSPSGEPHPILRDAVDYAASQGVLIVAAVGNDGCECLHVPSALESVLAVGAIDRNAQPLSFSNWGARYLKNGIMALGQDIEAALPGGRYGTMSGTSFAAAAVAGVAALLLSVQRKLGEPLSPAVIRQVLLNSATVCEPDELLECHRMMAGQLNIPNALELLISRRVLMSTVDDQAITESRPAIESATPPSQVHPSDCGCGCGGPTGSSTKNTTPPTTVQFVYALV